MFANVWPEVLEYLLRRTRLKKSEFAVDADIKIKTFSRYVTGETRVGKMFDLVAKGAKLTPDQLGYVYTSFLLKHYRPYRFDLGPELESEVKEPTATYDPPTARERAEALVRFDTLQVPPDLAPSLALLRRKIQEILDKHDEAIKELEADLLSLVELYEQMFEGSMHVWKELKTLRGNG